MTDISRLERAGLWIALVVGAYLLVPDPTSPVPAFLAVVLILTLEIALAGAAESDDRT
ncbi:MAG: hypothetical protein ABEJ05_08345 [Haloglomus sp.]